MTTPAAKWKAAERQRYKAAGLVAVTVWINPPDRIKLARYVKRLNQRAGLTQPGQASTTCLCLSEHTP